MKLEELPRKEKVFLYVIGLLSGLREKGLLEGGVNLTEGGEKLYAELKASGFVPTDEERDAAMAFLVRGPAKKPGWVTRLKRLFR